MLQRTLLISTCIAVAYELGASGSNSLNSAESTVQIFAQDRYQLGLLLTALLQLHALRLTGTAPLLLHLQHLLLLCQLTLQRVALRLQQRDLLIFKKVAKVVTFASRASASGAPSATRAKKVGLRCASSFVFVTSEYAIVDITRRGREHGVHSVLRDGATAVEGQLAIDGR
jgi:hypothetical protein